MPKKNSRSAGPLKTAYYAYLSSPKWKDFKTLKLQESPKVCASCASAEAVQLHHMVYRGDPQDSKLSDTLWLCLPCHRLYHKARPATMKGKTPPSDMVIYTLAVITRQKAIDEHRAVNLTARSDIPKRPKPPKCHGLRKT